MAIEGSAMVNAIVIVVTYEFVFKNVFNQHCS